MASVKKTGKTSKTRTALRQLERPGARKPKTQSSEQIEPKSKKAASAPSQALARKRSAGKASSKAAVARKSSARTTAAGGKSRARPTIEGAGRKARAKTRSASEARAARASTPKSAAGSDKPSRRAAPSAVKSASPKQAAATRSKARTSKAEVRVTSAKRASIARQAAQPKKTSAAKAAPSRTAREAKAKDRTILATTSAPVAKLAVKIRVAKSTRPLNPAAAPEAIAISMNPPSGANERTTVTKKIEKKTSAASVSTVVDAMIAPFNDAPALVASEPGVKAAAVGKTAKGLTAKTQTLLATPADQAKPVAVEILAEKAAEPKPSEKLAAPPSKPGKTALSPRQGFKPFEFIVYPAHGVGQIIAIEEQEVAGFKLELFVISFIKDKMILKVPTPKVASVGMRKLADADVVKKALDTLTGRARVKRTMWSRRAQEYEAKINSGDLISIAEVVRDLYRSDAQPEQSYSERQLYEAALDRMAREIVVVQKLTETESLKAIEAQLQKGPRRGKAEEIDAEEAEIEEAA